MRGRGRVLAIALAVALLPMMASGATAADDDGAVTIADEERWTGVAPAVTTDVHRFDLAVDEAHWAASPGGLQIGIRWASESDDLELSVTGPDGAVHTSAGVVSMAESVFIASAPSGTYTVEVTSAGGPDIAYEAVAQVERDIEVDPARPLIPDLTSLPARSLHFAVGAYLFDPIHGGLDVHSCYPEEMVEQGARKCLRFDQIIENVGEGPFELRYSVPPESAYPSGDPSLVTFENLNQRIYWSDRRTPTDVVADTYEFHPAHAHFHYRQFAVSALWRTDASGTKLDSDSGPATKGRKNGFCMVDVENTWFGRLGDAARTYRPPACLAPTEGTENVNGISRGWADIYNWFLADQFIEVSSLTDGFYALETVADPGNTVIESDETNNCTAVLIELSAGVTQATLHHPIGAC